MSSGGAAEQPGAGRGEQQEQDDPAAEAERRNAASVWAPSGMPAVVSHVSVPAPSSATEAHGGIAPSTNVTAPEGVVALGATALTVALGWTAAPETTGVVGPHNRTVRTEGSRDRHSPGEGADTLV
jgi:hypothetical protein